MTTIDPTQPVNNSFSEKFGFSKKRNENKHISRSDLNAMHQVQIEENPFVNLGRDELGRVLLDELAKTDETGFNYKSVYFILKLDANLDLLNSNNESVLTLAIKNNRANIALCLLDSLNDLDTIDNLSFRTPLLLALENSQKEVANKLLFKLCNVDYKDPSGVSSLMLASKAGFDEIVAKLLKKSASLLTQNDEDGQNALHYAAMVPKSKSYELLVNAGLNPLHADTNKITPLHVAVNNKNYNAVDLHSKKGYAMNPKDFRGLTPIEYACQNGLRFMAQLLFERDNNLLTKYCLSYSVSSKNYDLAKFVVEKLPKELLIKSFYSPEIVVDCMPKLICDIDKKADYFPAELLNAASRNERFHDLAIFDVILSKIKKEDLNFCTKFGLSSLACCIQNSKYDFAKRLIGAGADVSVSVNSDLSPSLLILDAGTNSKHLKDALAVAFIDNSNIFSVNDIDKFYAYALGQNNTEAAQFFLDIMLARGGLPQEVDSSSGVTLQNRLVQGVNVSSNYYFNDNLHSGLLKEALIRNISHSPILIDLHSWNFNAEISTLRCNFSTIYENLHNSLGGSRSVLESDLTKLENLRFFDFSSLDKKKKNYYKISDSNMSSFDFASMDLSFLNPNACKRVRVDHSKNVPVFIAMHSVGMPKSIHGMNDSQMRDLLRKRDAGKFKG